MRVESGLGVPEFVARDGVGGGERGILRGVEGEGEERGKEEGESESEVGVFAAEVVGRR